MKKILLAMMFLSTSAFADDATFQKVDENSFTIEKSAPVTTQSYTLEALKIEKDNLVANIERETTRIAEIDALIAQAKAAGVKAKDGIVV